MIRKFFQSFLRNTIKDDYSQELRMHIRNAILINFILIFFVILVALLMIKSPNAVLLMLIPLFLHLFSLFLIRFHYHKLGRFLLSITTSSTVYFIASYIYIHPTVALPAKFLMLISIIVPFSVFSTKEKPFIFSSVLLTIFYLITFDYMNNLLNLSNIQDYDKPIYNIIATISLSIILVGVSYIYKLNIHRYIERINKLNYQINRQNEELATAEEELRQNNEELTILKKELEDSLQIITEKERLLNAIGDSINNPVLLIDDNEIIQYSNKASEKILGYTSDELIGKNVHDLLVPPELRKRAHNQFKLFKLTGEGNILNKRINIQALRKDGAKINILLYVSTLKFKNKIYAVGSMVDVSDEEYRKTILKKNEVKYRTIINTTNTGIVVLNENGIIIDANIKGVDIHGYDIYELFGKPLADIIYEEDKPKYEEARDLIFNNGEELVQMQVRFKHKNEKLVWINIIINKYYQPDIGKIYLLIAFQDISELKRIEKELNHTNKLLKEAHNSIIKSLHYAKTIQTSLLPDEVYISRYLKEFFIFYKAKNIVSGDFYYFSKINKHIIIAVGDCTGHGMHGAMLSILAISFLHEIIISSATDQPGEALNMLRERFKKIFGSLHSDAKHSVNIALIAINIETNILKYAGAYHPLILIRDNRLFTYKATRNPIGVYPVEVPFKTEYIPLKENDVIYLFSDGFQDQLNENLQKFTIRRFRELLLSIYSLDFDQQKEILEEVYNTWRKKQELTDDITIFGFKYNLKKENL